MLIRKIARITAVLFLSGCGYNQWTTETLLYGASWSDDGVAITYVTYERDTFKPLLPIGPNPTRESDKTLVFADKNFATTREISATTLFGVKPAGFNLVNANYYKSRGYLIVGTSYYTSEIAVLLTEGGRELLRTESTIRSGRMALTSRLIVASPSGKWIWVAAPRTDHEHEYTLKIVDTESAFSNYQEFSLILQPTDKIAWFGDDSLIIQREEYNLPGKSWRLWVDGRVEEYAGAKYEPSCFTYPTRNLAVSAEGVRIYADDGQLKTEQLGNGERRKEFTFGCKEPQPGL